MLASLEMAAKPGLHSCAGILAAGHTLSRSSNPYRSYCPFDRKCRERLFTVTHSYFRCNATTPT